MSDMDDSVRAIPYGSVDRSAGPISLPWNEWIGMFFTVTLFLGVHMKYSEAIHISIPSICNITLVVSNQGQTDTT